MTDSPAGSEIAPAGEAQMSQEDADKAFELDLAHAGLLDSSLEGGDTPGADASPASAAPASVPPGAPPKEGAAEPPPAPPKAAATIAGKEAAPAGTPAAPAEPAGAAAAPEPTGEELAAKAIPFAFTSDGKSSTVDVIQEIPGVGVVIEAPHIEKFRNMMQTADKALRDNVTLRAREAEYQRLGGSDKYRELESRAAALDAMGTELLTILNNPERLITLATDPRERDLLLRELQWKGQSTAQTATQKFTDTFSQVANEGNAARADQIAFEGALTSIYQALPMLTAEDQQAIRTQFSQPGMQQALFRKATADDAKYGFQVGQRLIDIPLMHPYADSLARIRIAQKADAEARIKAENENRARLGPPATPTKPRAPVQRAAPGNKKKGVGELGPDDDGSYAYIKNRHLSGRFAGEHTAE